MKFTLDIPVGVITPGEFQSFEAVRAMATALETAGVDAAYVTDHPAPSSEWLHANGHDALDPFTALSFVAASTTTLRLHTNILVMAYRNPFLTAKAAASLHTLSGGRLILGVGAGYQKVEFEALGVDFHKRGALFDEALDVVRQAWAGGAIVWQGRNFNATGNEPRPALSSPPPIWIGGGSGKALERAARAGDGWCPFFAAPTMTAANQESGIHSVEQLGENIVQLNEMRAAANRSGPFDICIGARKRLKFGDGDSAATYVDAIGEMAQVGVTWTMVEPRHSSRQEYIDNVQWFGENVIAKLRG
ncbi:MAG TPA: TIGR03619 family F420-dependent LLM class oxidoreductase [Sphingobium sp.]